MTRVGLRVEPLRALDSVHLASALLCRQEVGDVELATTDDRLRQNAAKLRFPLLPRQPAQ
jgi:hypothetical protein